VSGFSFGNDAYTEIPSGTLGLATSFGGFGSFSTFAGGIGIDYVLAPRMHLRPMLNFGFDSGKTKTESGTTTTETDLPNNFLFGVNASFLFDLMQTRAVPYVGAKAGFFMDNTSSTTETDVGGIVTVVDNTDRTMNISVDGILGARVHLNDYFCFFGEFTLGFTLQIEKQETETSTTVGGTTTTTTNTTTTTRPNFGTGSTFGGNVGLTIYFF